ncbi:hypothetical protein CIB48_g9805 [Xylaria polymorpha]|nr:hypothetical protein CIB48_g9805 [Xylaria polymorpha]
MESFCLGRGRVVDDTIHQKREGRLKYLTLLAQDSPDLWVCEVFEDLFPVHQYDIPSGRFDLTCLPRRPEWNSLAYGPSSKCRLDERHIGIDHRHVHLALKYARMQNTYYWAYLKAMLKPYHAEYSAHCEYGVPVSKIKSFGAWNKRFNVKYSVFPEIVMGNMTDDAGQSDEGELRFLLRSRWIYRFSGPPCVKRKRNSLGKGRNPGFYKGKATLDKNEEPSKLRQVIGHLRICPHMQTCQPNCPTHGPAEGRCDLLGIALDTAFSEICNSPGAGHVVKRGACKRCPTDFEVRASSPSFLLSASIKIKIQVWQDLGTEKTSPVCPEWRAHVRSLSAREPNFDNYGMVVDHLPGSIQRLYNQKQEESLTNYLGGTHVMRRLRWCLGRHERADKLLRKVSAKYRKV